MPFALRAELEATEQRIMKARPESQHVEQPHFCSVSFLKIARRPRFALIRSQGERPRPRADFGPVDLAGSFGFQVPCPRGCCRVAKACRNLVGPLAIVVGGVTWIDERGMHLVREFLATYRRCLSIKALTADRFLRMYGHIAGTAAARTAWDEALRGLKKEDRFVNRWRADEQGRLWELYTTRERDPRSRRFKLGISFAPARRCTELKAGRRRPVRIFTSKAAAHAVEQGLHGLLFRFQDRRPRRAGVHGGDTEWYRPAARRLVSGAAAFFSEALARCLARATGRKPPALSPRARKPPGIPEFAPFPR